MQRRSVIGAALAGAMALSAGAPAWAQDYPSEPISFIVWSSPGSPLDTMMRQLAKQLSSELDVEIPVENRTGGSGAVAMSYVRSQPADGYIALSTTSSMTFTMAKGQVPFTPDDFVVLRALQSEPSSVAVRADSGLQSLDDFVTAMQEDPDALSVGGYASAGFHQFVYYRLQQEAGFGGDWVPFDGGNEAALALLGGHIDVAVMTPSSAQAQIENGDIRLLGVSAEERSEYFPEVPTFQEQGYEVNESIWRGLMVPSGTPQEAIDTLVAAIDEVQASEEWKAFMENNLQSRLDRSQEQMQQQVRQEVEARREFLEQGGYLQ